MKAAAVGFFLMGMIAVWFMLFRGQSLREYAEAETHVLAINFATYRNAAHQYVHHNQDKATGEITQTLFARWIPNGWLPMREWKVRVENSVCFVYGPASPDEIDAIRKLYRGSFALGRKEGGRLVPDHGGSMPVPDWIPDGSMVSMTEVRP